MYGGGEKKWVPADQSVIREFAGIKKNNLIFHLLKCSIFRLIYIKIMIIKMPLYSTLQYTLEDIFLFTTKFPASLIYNHSKESLLLKKK